MCTQFKKIVFVLTLGITGLIFAALPVRGICAHRGNGCGQPENTVPAWTAAAAAGAEMVEMDVKQCRTGELIIMHDETVDRTTDGSGRVAKLTFTELRALTVKGSHDRLIRIPTFDEAIDCLPKNGLWINCHCAANTAVEVAHKIRAKGRLHQAFIATDLRAIAAARREVPEILVCNMSRPLKGGSAYSKPWPPEMSTLYAQQTIEHHCAFLQLLQPCAPSDIKALHDAGVKVAYFHCEKPQDVQALKDLGVDFILTDNLKPVRAAFLRAADQNGTEGTKAH